jgi:hypothetical protein
MVTWVLEKNVFAEDCFDNMVGHFGKVGIPYHVVTIKPFIHTIAGDIPKIDGPCVVYGSIGSQKLAKANGWTPGVWTNDQFNEDVLVEKLGPDYLNYDARVVPFKDVLASVPWYRNIFFIKPNTDTKEFAGMVISRDKFEEWTNKMMDTGYLDENIFDKPMVISSVKALGCEWRTIIVDGKVSDYSCVRQYQRVMAEHWMPEAAIEFAERAAYIHSPAPVFALDVAESVEGYKVIEYNAFNSSGLYKCNVAKIIDDVNAYVEANYKA